MCKVALALASPISFFATHVIMVSPSSLSLFAAEIRNTVPCGISNMLYSWNRRLWGLMRFVLVSHSNVGVGNPEALQKKLTIKFSATFMFFGALVIFGAAEKQKENR